MAFDGALRGLVQVGTRPGKLAHLPQLRDDLEAGLRAFGLPLGRVYRARMGRHGRSWQLRDDGPGPLPDDTTVDGVAAFCDSTGSVAVRISSSHGGLAPGDRPVVSLAWRGETALPRVTLIQVAAAPYLIRSTSSPASTAFAGLFTDADLHRALTGAE